MSRTTLTALYRAINPAELIPLAGKNITVKAAPTGCTITGDKTEILACIRTLENAGYALTMLAEHEPPPGHATPRQRRGEHNK